MTTSEQRHNNVFRSWKMTETNRNNSSSSESVLSTTKPLKRKQRVYPLASLFVILFWSIFQNDFVQDVGLHYGGLENNIVITASSSRDMVGTWMGNTWIPPSPWRLYNAQELLDFYGNKTILITGDSLARRSFATMHSILEAAAKHETPKVAQLNDGRRLDLNYIPKPCNISIFADNPNQIPAACVKMPGKHNLGYLLLIQPVYCIGHMTGLLAKETRLLQERQMAVQNNSSSSPSLLTDVVDVWVVANGAWEEGNKDVCQRNKSISIDEKIDKEMEALRQYTTIQSSSRVVYRTAGFFDGTAERSDTALVERMNERSMEWMDRYNNGNLSYINWGGAVAERSHGNDRIVGDHVAHYGTEPRMVMWQMLTNHLQDLEAFSEGTD
jgi:hypothetical protein